MSQIARYLGIVFLLALGLGVPGVQAQQRVSAEPQAPSGTVQAPREVVPPDAADDLWEIQNPKSRELKHLRVSLLPGLLQTAARNLRHGAHEVRLVEAGPVFRASPPPLGSRCRSLHRV